MNFLNQSTEHKSGNFSNPAAISYLIAYDISDERRRNQLRRLLRGFGEPVQQTVFMCWLDAVRQRRLKALLEDFMRESPSGRERIDCKRVGGTL
jgi:CRISPR-associated protein Cas2